MHTNNSYVSNSDACSQFFGTTPPLSSPPPSSAPLGSGTGNGVEGTGAGVAHTFFDNFFFDIIEEDIVAVGQAPPGLTASAGGFPAWSSITTFTMAQRAATLMGFDPSGSDCWAMIGVRVDSSPPLAGDLERKRNLLRTLFSAGEANGWNENDKVLGHAFVAKLEESIGRCHLELPELAKKLRKKKAGKNLVPMWQEPSYLLFEYGAKLSEDGTISALHLSNLQGHPLDLPSFASENNGGMPKVLPVQETRELYTRLSQQQPAVESALRVFSEKNILIWAPENRDQVPIMVAAVQKLFVREGVRVSVELLIPYAPLPGCGSPDLILDLWTHPLMQPKYKDCVASVTFVREASKCVFTRNGNPLHTVKNVVAVRIQAESTGKLPQCISMRNTLLDIPVHGLAVLVDGPANCIQSICLSLNAANVSNGAGGTIDWRVQRRSRAHTAEHPRSVLVGQTVTQSLLLIKGIVFGTKNIVGGRGDCLVGHTGMFGDNTNILMEGSLPQILLLQEHVSECTVISPARAIYSRSLRQTFFVVHSQQMRHCTQWC